MPMNQKRYPTLKIKLKLSPTQIRKLARVPRWEKESAKTVISVGPGKD